MSDQSFQGHRQGHHTGHWDRSRRAGDLRNSRAVATNVLITGLAGGDAMFGFGRKPLDEADAIAYGIRAACLLQVRLEDEPKLKNMEEHIGLTAQFVDFVFRESNVKPSRRDRDIVEMMVTSLVTEGSYIKSVINKVKSEGKEFRSNNTDIMKVRKIVDKALEDYRNRR